MVEGNDFGEKVKFEVGDKVKIWRIFRNPVGTVEAVRVDPEKKPIFYLVKYIYPDHGTEYVEEFESSELTLHTRRSTMYSQVCECGSDKFKSPRHSTWCPKYRKE